MNGKYNINAWNDLPKDVTEEEKDSDIILWAMNNDF